MILIFATTNVGSKAGNHPISIYKDGDVGGKTLDAGSLRMTSAGKIIRIQHLNIKKDHRGLQSDRD